MTEPHWITLAEALAIHRRSLVAAGGAPGVRDPGLLDAALARPRQRAAYEDVSIFELGAAYTEAIVRNHPFVDGNKRTGFVVGLVFLEKNGVLVEADPVVAAERVVRLAAGEESGADYAAFLAANVRA